MKIFNQEEIARLLRVLALWTHGVILQGEHLLEVHKEALHSGDRNSEDNLHKLLINEHFWAIAANNVCDLMKQAKGKIPQINTSVCKENRFSPKNNESYEIINNLRNTREHYEKNHLEHLQDNESIKQFGIEKDSIISGSLILKSLVAENESPFKYEPSHYFIAGEVDIFPYLKDAEKILDIIKTIQMS